MSARGLPIVFACPATAMAATPAGLTVEHQANRSRLKRRRRCWAGTAPATRTRSRSARARARWVTSGTRARCSRASRSTSRTAARRCPNATRLYWTVRTFEGDRASAYAPTASFGTAVKSAWTATPIWSSAPVLGTDYDVDVDFTVTTVAAGIKFRVNGSNSFMWQIRGDSSNELRPHVQVNGTYSQLKAVRLPMTIGLNTKHHARINVGRLDHPHLHRRRARRHHGRHPQPERLDRLPPRQHGVRAVRQRQGHEPTACCTERLLRAEHRLQLRHGHQRRARRRHRPRLLVRRHRQLGVPAQGRSASPTSRSRGPRPTSPRAPPSPPASTSSSSASTARSSASARRARSTTRRRRCTTRTTSRRCSSAGDNALGALAYTTADKKFIAQLVIAYADGTREVVNSDAAWKALAGEVAIPQAGSIGTSYYAAPVENIDARKYPCGFDTPAFDDSAWNARRPKSAIQGLTGTPAANVEQRLREPVSRGQDRRQALLPGLRPHGRRRGATASSTARAARRSRSGWARS